MTRCQLLLSLLEDAGPRGITTSEILQAGVGSRYGARIHDLRKMGYVIRPEAIRRGSWRYTLEPEPKVIECHCHDNWAVPAQHRPDCPAHGVVTEPNFGRKDDAGVESVPESPGGALDSGGVPVPSNAGAARLFS